MIRILLAVILCCAAGSVVPQATAQIIVTEAQVNGTWKTKGGEFKVWALGKQNASATSARPAKMQQGGFDYLDLDDHIIFGGKS